IFFVPTHSLELIEVSALKEAVKNQMFEPREPLVLSYDVLVQFMVTLALGGGFRETELKSIVQKTFSFQWMRDEDWSWCLYFITAGGKIGKNYEEFHKVILNEEGLYVIRNRKMAM